MKVHIQIKGTAEIKLEQLEGLIKQMDTFIDNWKIEGLRRLVVGGE